MGSSGELQEGCKPCTREVGLVDVDGVASFLVGDSVGGGDGWAVGCGGEVGRRVRFGRGLLLLLLLLGVVVGVDVCRTGVSGTNKRVGCWVGTKEGDAD